MTDTVTKGQLERVPGKQNWVDRAGGLPNYIERIAVHLHREKGMSIGHAIATAVNAVKKMCATGDLNWPGAQQANAGSRSQACAAVASWEAKKKGTKVAKGDKPWTDAAFIEQVLGFSITKHGSHDQGSHGNWAHGPDARTLPVHVAAQNFDYAMGSSEYTDEQKHQAAVAYGEHVVRRLSEGEEVSTAELVRLGHVYEMMRAGPPRRQSGSPEEMYAHRIGGAVVGHRSVRKRDFSTERRKQAAKEGHALPDGSFPIYNEEDLRNAKRLLHHAKNKAAAAAHIARWERKLSKSRFDFDVPITKVDTDQQLAFGWANITVDEHGDALIDKQGDVIDIVDLEKAAYDYVINSRDGGEMHQRRGVSTLVESFVVTPEKLEKIGLPPDAMPAGWWVGFKVHDPDVWDGVKSGKYSMFSIHGTGKRKAVES